MPETTANFKAGSSDSSFSASGAQRIENLRHTGLYDNVLDRVDQARELQDRANRINLEAEDETRLGEFVQRMHQLEAEKASGRPMSGDNQVELDYYHLKFAPEVAEAKSDRDGAEAGMKKLQELRSKPGFDREGGDKIEMKTLEEKYGAELDRRDKEQKKANAADRKLSKNAAIASRRLETAADAARMTTQAAREKDPTAPPVEPSFYDDDLAAVAAYRDATDPLRQRANGFGDPLSVDEQARLDRLEKSYRAARTRAAKKESPQKREGVNKPTPEPALTSSATEIAPIPTAVVDGGEEPPPAEEDLDPDHETTAEEPQEFRDAFEEAAKPIDDQAEFAAREEVETAEVAAVEAEAEAAPAAEAEAHLTPTLGYDAASMGVATSAPEPAPATSEPDVVDRLRAALVPPTEPISRAEAAGRWVRNLGERLQSNFEDYKEHPGKLLTDGKGILQDLAKAWWKGIMPVGFYEGRTLGEMIKTRDVDLGEWWGNWKKLNLLYFTGGVAAGAAIDIIALFPGLGALRPAARITLASVMAGAFGWSETREKRRIGELNLNPEEKRLKLEESAKKYKNAHTKAQNALHGFVAGQMMGGIVQAFGIDKAGQDFVNKLFKPAPQEAPEISAKVPDAGVTETAGQALGDTIDAGEGMLSIDLGKVFPDFHGSWEAAPGAAGTSHPDLVKMVMDKLYHASHAGAIQPGTVISPDSFTADQLDVINRVSSVSSYQDYLNDVGGVRTLVNSVLKP